MPLALIAFLGLLLALIPAGIVQVQLEREARDARTRDLEAQAMQLASLVGRQVASTLDSARHTLRTMAAHEDIRRLEASAACDLFLQRVVAVTERYATVNVFDREGNAICASNPAVLGVNVGDRPYFRETLRTGRMRLGEYATGRASGQPSLHLSQPLMGAGGVVGGVLVIAISVEWLNDELRALMLPEGGVAVIADREGVVLARSADPERFVGRPLTAIGMDMLHAASPGVREATSLDGMVRTVAFLPVTDEPEGLFVAVGLDTASAIAAQEEANVQAAVMVVGSLLLTFVVGLVFFNAAVDRPVQRMLRVANHWARQDWRARVGHIRGGRELQRLAAALDTMADAVLTREAARRRALTRMEAVVGVAPQIVMTADRAGHVDWTNPYWQELTGFDTARSLGLGWMDATHPEDRPGLRAAWDAMVASGLGDGAQGFSHEVRLCRAEDKQWRWHLMKGAAIRHDPSEIAAWAMVGIDFHELREVQAQAEATAAQLRATYENAPVGLCLLDRDLRFIAINDMLAAIHGVPVAEHIGRTLSEVAPDMPPIIEEAMRRVIATGEAVEELEVVCEVDGQPRVWLASYRPIFGADGSLTCVSGSKVDITARKRVEESERLLSREVDHRAQNALAVVRGLIRLSAADAPDDVPALVEVLEGRIAAMSRAHTLLSREKWVGAELGEIVREEFAPQSGRIHAEGPAVRLTAEAAQPLTLVLHELVTNALKYGALSVPEGKVTLRWERQQEKLHMQWCEEGGPPMVQAPLRRGFGTRLIDANIRGLLAGDIERDWAETGLRCTLVLGAEALAGSRFVTGLRETSPLAGRRVIVAVENPAEARSLAGLLRASGCAVLGPAASIEEAVELIEAEKRVDAAILSGTLQGRSAQPLAQLLRRRASALLFLNTLGLESENDEAPPRMLHPPHTAEGIRRALVEALEAARNGS
ncbi:MAG TPA: PAS domain-containing protein [Roseococcus sp.]|nr:PAS domain-containing protein [Roseococcus sp.]